MNPQKTTVLHVILSLEIGGMEQVVADLVRNLDRRRFNPVVACVESLGPIAEELIASGIKVVKLQAMTPIVSFLYPAPLVRIMRESGASVVHAHSGCLYKTAVAARLAGIGRIIYTDHGRTFPDKKLVVVFDRIFVRLTSRVVAVSRELGEYLHRTVGIPEAKITMIRNGTRLDHRVENAELTGDLQTPPPQIVVVGIVARLVPVKDVATLLHAMELVIRAFPQARLQIVGDGPERAGLERLSRTLGLDQHVMFHGFRRDVPAVLAGFDIFVLSSLSEGTSVTLLEAMAAGKPAVVTQVGGNPSLVEHGRNGFLVPPGQAVAMAEALLVLIRDPGMRHRFGEQNRKKAMEEFSVDVMVRQYEVLYESGQ